MRSEIYKDAKGEYRWKIIAGNNEVVADSNEGYVRRADALHGLGLVLGMEQPPEPGDELDEAVHPTALTRGPDSVLAGQRLLPREVAALVHDNRWSAHERAVEAVAIVYAESAGYTEAVGGPNKDGSYDLGMWQLNTIHAARLGMNEAEYRAMAFDPPLATRQARRLYVDRDYTFGPWAAYGNGSFRRHLQPALVGVANAFAARQGWNVPFVTYS